MIYNTLNPICMSMLTPCWYGMTLNAIPPFVCIYMVSTILSWVIQIYFPQMTGWPCLPVFMLMRVHIFESSLAVHCGFLNKQFMLYMSSTNPLIWIYFINSFSIVHATHLSCNFHIHLTTTNIQTVKSVNVYFKICIQYHLYVGLSVN